MANANIDKSIISSVKIQELAGVLEPQTTNFGIQHKITTSEWQFVQEMYPIEDFVLSKVNNYVKEWDTAVGSTTAKGRLIWLYVNKDTNPECIENVHKLINAFEGKPIVVMLLNDTDNRMFDSLVEYSILDTMDFSIRKKYERHYDEDYARAESNLKDEIESLRKQRIHFGKGEIEALSLRMPMYLTKVFEEIYPYAVPFFFDGFITKGNNIGNKAAGFYCSFLKMLLSNSVSEATIHNFVVEMRNRVESLFSTTSLTSWRCINDKCKLIPPEEKNAKRVYDLIVDEINKNQELPCEKIYNIFCKPPYGMSEDVVTLMIAVVCANLNYCLRVRYHSLKNINVWKEEVVTNNDKKVDLKVIKESVIVFVDAGAVTGKYMRFFDKIKRNTSIQEVNLLSNTLKEMVSVDEVPEELEQAYLLAQKTLDSGKKAKNEWNSVIGAIDEKFEAAQDSNNPYNALVALEGLRDLPISRIFNDNGYEYDDELRASVKDRINEISDFLAEVMGSYVANMYCKSVEGINTFRNHNTKVETKLRALGFSAYADAVRKKREEELCNIEEIRSRQELRTDYEKYIEESRIDKFTSYVVACRQLKDGLEIQKRVDKYKNALGRDSAFIIGKLDERIAELTKFRDRIKQDMTDIWDDLLEVKSSEDIEDLIERITIVLQKGIATTDQSDFSELKGDLQELLADINQIKDSINSRKDFETVSICVKEKYAESDFDFEVSSIIEAVIDEILKKINEKEERWKQANLSLGDKSRANVHKWKEKTKYLPEYLSEDTKKRVAELSKDADDIISEGKIEDVIFYFEKLDEKEKIECIQKIQALVD